MLFLFYKYDKFETITISIKNSAVFYFVNHFNAAL